LKATFVGLAQQVREDEFAVLNQDVPHVFAVEFEMF
jgi:hypothetical protein